MVSVLDVKSEVVFYAGTLENIFPDFDKINYEKKEEKTRMVMLNILQEENMSNLFFYFLDTQH